MRAEHDRKPMATYRGRKTDICRTVGYDIWGRPKSPGAKRVRDYPAGQHGPNLKDRRQSEYGEQRACLARPRQQRFPTCVLDGHVSIERQAEDGGFRRDSAHYLTTWEFDND